MLVLRPGTLRSQAKDVYCLLITARAGSLVPMSQVLLGKFNESPTATENPSHVAGQVSGDRNIERP